MTPAASARGFGERGYAMAVLLVTLAIMSVVLGVAMPAWRTGAQRDREEELIFRGRQYSRAIGLFQRRYANAYPPSIDVLVEQRFLRKKFKDPMTETGEFVVLYQGSAFSLPGGRGASATGPGRQQAGGSASPFGGGTASAAGGRQGGAPSVFGTAARGGVGPQGGIIGVVSASEEKSLRILDGRSQYNEWRFVWLPTAGAGRGGGVNQPGGRGRGVDQPGGRGRGVDQPGGFGEGGGFGQGRGGQGGGRGQGRGGQPFGSPGQNPGRGRG